MIDKAIAAVEKWGVQQKVVDDATRLIQSSLVMMRVSELTYRRARESRRCWSACRILS